MPVSEGTYLHAGVSRRTHVGALDGLRALCCLGVVLYHMGMPWCQGGLLGVTALFVLSGYLATAGLLREFGASGRIDLRGYWRRRLWRLMPQVVAFLAATACLLTVCDHVLLTKMRADLLPALLMVLNWSKILRQESYFAAAEAPSPLTHFWSLSIEAQFFLLWPPLLYLLLRHGVARRSASRGLLVAIGVSALLMALLYTPGQDPSRSYYGTDTRAFSLLVGALLAFWWPLGERSATPAGGLANARLGLAVRVCSWAAPAALVALMLLTEGYSPFSYYGGTLLCSVVAAAAVAALVVPGTSAAKALSWRPLTWVGKRSYAIYLWHYPLVELMNPRNVTTPKAWWQVLLQLALVLVVADLSYRLVERPWRHGAAEPLARLRALVTGEGPVGRPVPQATPRRGSSAPDRGADRGGGRLPGRTILARLGLAACALVVAVGVGGLALVPDAGAAAGGGHRVMQASLKKPLVDGVYDVVLVGDSVSLDAKDQFGAAFPHGLMDSRVSRQPKEALQVLQGYLDQGVVGDTVIVSVGINSPLDNDLITQFHDAVGDERKLWFVNVRTPDPVYKASNAAIQWAADTYDNVGVIDWYSASAGHDDWFWDDGTHTRPEGSQAYVDLVRDTIGYVEPTDENTHYDVTVVGDEVAMGAADQLAAAFPQGLVDTAARDAQGTAETFRSYLDQGVVGDKVVVAVGAGEQVSRDQLEALAAAVGDSRTLWLVNTRSAAAFCEMDNEAVQAVADAYDNVRVIDWYAASAGHDDYLQDDGMHLTEAGADAYAQLVADAVAQG